MITPTLFYPYSQFNSEGFFVVTDSVTQHVWIEAENPNHADEIAQTLGIYFDGCRTGRDCACCGDRWAHAWGWDAEETPNLTPTPNGRGTVVHYLDGRVVWA